MVNLEVKLKDLILKNPVMTASGTFGYGEEFEDFIDINQLGGILVKGTTRHHREGNPYPRMAETASGMLNAVGLQNKGVEYFCENIYPRINHYDTNILVNVSGSTISDYIETAAMINELDQIHRQAKKIDEGVSGFVSISYPGSIAFKFLPNFLETLNQNLPDLKLELIEPTDGSHENLLLNYEIDIAFSRDHIQHININSLKLQTEPICLVIPDNHWLNTAELNNLNDLKDEKFIIAGLHQKTFFASLLRTFFNKNNFQPKTIIESDFGGMILNLVSKGIGISILPWSFKFSKYKNVKFIKLDENIDLYINWRKNDPNKTVKKVLEYAKSMK